MHDKHSTVEPLEREGSHRGISVVICISLKNYKENKMFFSPDHQHLQDTPVDQENL